MRIGYHYTTIEALFNIIRSGVIHIGDTKFMNDPDEYLYGLNLLSDYIKINHPDSYQRFLLNKKEKNFDESAFVFSLTHLSDDVSQWRTYADGGRGVMIGFDLDMLQEKLDDILTIESESVCDDLKVYTYSLHDSCGLEDCIYDKSKQINLIKSKLPNLENSHSYSDYVLQDLAIYCSARFKNQNYNGESEIRLYFGKTIIKAFGYALDLYKPLQQGEFRISIDYKVNKYGVTEFIPLPVFFSQKGISVKKSVIHSITLGPNAISENRRSIARYIYSKHKVVYNIEQSEVKMR